MNISISKARPRRSGVRLSKRLQEQLLNAISIPPSARPTKRQLDDIDQPPTKKVRLTKTEQLDIDGGGTQLADKFDQTPVLQHPKPNLPYASFLEKFVDPPFPPSVHADSEHSFVLDWLETVGSDRDTHCRSDSYLQPIDDNSPIPRGLSRSAPAMGYARDTDGFAIPSTPASIGSRSRADTNIRSITPSNVTGSSGPPGRSLVENPLYRRMHLATNNIYMRSYRDQLPDHVVDLIDRMRRDRNSPGPTRDQVLEDKALEQLGIGSAEPQVEEYFKSRIFPNSDPDDSLEHSNRQPMAKHTVPSTGSSFKVSTPVPDLLYGYNRQMAFPKHQPQLISMGMEMVVSNQVEDLVYPFLIVEFKGDGGSMWVATNQCLGGSASCVNIAENLNYRLRQCKSNLVHPIDSAAFSIAISNSEARLYISWKQDELDYYTAKVDSFLLQDPEHYIKFRKYIRNIIDWGRDERLEGIHKALDSLLEESRKTASAAAKSRMPPFSDSVRSGSRSSSKTRKTSSMGQSSRVEGGEYWKWDGTIGRWFHQNADGTLSWAEREEEQRPGGMSTSQA